MFGKLIVGGSLLILNLYYFYNILHYNLIKITHKHLYISSNKRVL